MSILREGILAMGGSMTLSIIAKATVALALGLIGARLARRRRAAVRHALLAASFGVLLFLPIASFVAPPVRIAVPVAAREQTTPASFAGGFNAMPHVAQVGTGGGTVSVVQRPWALSLPALLFAGWVVGALLFMLPMVTGLWRIRLLRRSALPWSHGQSAAAVLNFDQRRVEVLLHEGVAGPMTCGITHPAIVLPSDALTWDADDLNRALAHELEHVRRGDRTIHCLARTLCAIYWFHPLVWIAWGQLTLEAERSCDDAVLQRSDATAYADQLVGLAQRLSTVRKSAALAMANRSDLPARVGAVLDKRQQRGRAGALLVAIACAIAALFVIAISPVTIVAAPQSSSSQPSNASQPAFEVASVKVWPSSAVGGVTIQFSPDSVALRGVDLWISLTVAYGVRDFQLSGPDWLQMAPKGSGNRYDILAKTPGPVPESQLRLMLQRLLADRFHLLLHRDRKEIPVFALLVAKGGPRFHETQAGTEVDSTWAGFANVRHELIRGADGRGGHSFTNAPMAALAAALSASMPFAPEPVVDMTELPGRFDFVLHDAPRPAPSDGPPNFDETIAAQKAIIQDELGLTLERRKAPVDILVVDHVDKMPTPN